MNKTVTVTISAKSIVLTIALLLALWVARQIPDIIITVVIALIVAAALTPGINHFHKKLGWPRVASVLAMFGIIFGVFILMGLIVVPTLIDQAETLASNLPAYTQKIQGTYAWLRHLDTRFHVLPSLDDAAKTISGFAAGWLTSTLGWAGKLLGGVATVFLIVIIAFFLLLDGPDLKKGLLALIPPEHRPTIDAQFEPVTLKLGGYVQGLMLSIGFLMLYLGITLSIAGVPLALVLALLAGSMEIIPMVGSLLGSIPAILIALTVSWQLALVVVAIFLGGNFIQGNFVAPFVFSRSVDVSPVMITLALLVGGSLLGIPGALIAVPVLAAVIVLVQNLYVEPMERHAAETSGVKSMGVEPETPVTEGPPTPPTP